MAKSEVSEQEAALSDSQGGGAPPYQEKLRKKLSQLRRELKGELRAKEGWLDENEDGLDEADHEEAVRLLDVYESVLECLEEALEALEED